jgi:hypothetical protein
VASGVFSDCIAGGWVARSSGGGGPTTFYGEVNSTVTFSGSTTAIWSQSIPALPAGKCVVGHYHLTSLGGSTAPTALTISADGGTTGANVITAANTAVMQPDVQGRFTFCNRVGSQTAQRISHAVHAMAEPPAYSRGSVNNGANAATTSAPFTLGLYGTGGDWQVQVDHFFLVVY